MAAYAWAIFSTLSGCWPPLAMVCRSASQACWRRLGSPYMSASSGRDRGTVPAPPPCSDLEAGGDEHREVAAVERQHVLAEQALRRRQPLAREDRLPRLPQLPQVARRHRGA